MDKKKRFKRIIAREGIILLIFFVASLALLVGGYKFNKEIYKKYFDEVVVVSPKYKALHEFDKKYEVKPRFCERRLLPQPLYGQEKYMYEKGYNPYLSHTAKVVGFYLFIFGYPVYLLTRFIIWAIKTLKER